MAVGYMRSRRVLPVLGVCTTVVLYVQVVMLNSGHTDRLTDTGVDQEQDRHIPALDYVEEITSNSNVTLSDSLMGEETSINYADFPDVVREFLLQFEKQTHTNSSPPLWQRELYNRTINQIQIRKYFLTELLMVRLYSSDSAKWTIRELKQWVHYMFLIGAEHIFICDHYHDGDDDMEAQLVKYIILGLVSYKRIYTHKAMTAQVQCYSYWVNRNRDRSSWMTSVDMDEYPYVVQDTQENCLQRYLLTYQQINPTVGEISMPNYLMLGQGDRTKDMVVDRIRRVTPKAANKLVKPIFQPKSYIPGIHHGMLGNRKKQVESDHGELRMLHYWGSRLQDWGPDTPYMLNVTVPFSDMADTWAHKIRNSLLTFGELDAFSSQTGP